MNFLVRLIVSTLAILVTSMVLPGVHIDSAITGIIVAAVLALLNAIVKPVLVVLTIPISVFTLGFFLLVINAFIIMMTSNLVKGFKVEGFWTAFFFSIILSLVTSVFNMLGEKEK
jgi:putative membrane protein